MGNFSQGAVAATSVRWRRGGCGVEAAAFAAATRRRRTALRRWLQLFLEAVKREALWRPRSSPKRRTRRSKDENEQKQASDPKLMRL